MYSVHRGVVHSAGAFARAPRNFQRNTISVDFRRSMRDCRRFVLKEPTEEEQEKDEVESVTPDAVYEEAGPSSGIAWEELDKEFLVDKALDDVDPQLRTTKIIIEIVNSGEALEETIEKYRDHINEDLLETMYKRIVAAELTETKETIEGLMLLWRRLRSELERQRATPAMKLLDELLIIISPSEGGTPKQRLRDVAERMAEAFSGPQTRSVDIFALASDLAEGMEPPEDLVQDYVARNDFIQEVEALIEEASGVWTKAQKQLQAVKAEMRKAEEGSAEQRALDKQLATLRKNLSNTESSMEQVRLLLRLAKELKLNAM